MNNVISNNINIMDFNWSGMCMRVPCGDYRMLQNLKFVLYICQTYKQSQYK